MLQSTYMSLLWLFFLLLLSTTLVWFIWRNLQKSVAPYVPLPADVRRKVFDALDLQKDDRIIELGCGSGDFLIQLARERGLYGTGIELDLFWFLVSFFRAQFYFQGKIHIVYGNIFNLNISPYNKVYAYLMKRSYSKLHEKCSRELKDGSVLVLAGWPFDDTSPSHQIVKEGGDQIFTYRF